MKLEIEAEDAEWCTAGAGGEEDVGARRAGVGERGEEEEEI